MTHDEVQRWLDDYTAAWRANEAGPIEALFADDATYSYRPWDSDEHTVRGRDAIVASWLEEPDAPGDWDAEYHPFAVDGDRAVAVGWSRYAATSDAPERLYHNAYLLRFSSDGRCTEFHEFYMEKPS
jgi:ketosteroid isomerase-like protein